MAMPLLTPAVDLAVGRMERSEQCGGTVALVVVRHGLAAARLQRQAGLGTIESLDLAFLVHAQLPERVPADSGKAPRCLPAFLQIQDRC